MGDVDHSDRTEAAAAIRMARIHNKARNKLGSYADGKQHTSTQEETP